MAGSCHNDGYGCGYGQNGYDQSGGTEAERQASLDANLQNLHDFTEYANAHGVSTGLWTQSNLSPIASEKQQLVRDFRGEVNTGGITTLKTDVAWVGSGYTFGLNGIKTAYDIVTGDVSTRPNIVTLDGWAGTQRYGAIWTGDQYGGNWEYIRFHIPTYIGQYPLRKPEHWIRYGRYFRRCTNSSLLVTTSGRRSPRLCWTWTAGAPMLNLHTPMAIRIPASPECTSS